jgi:hypothetical protein
MSCSRNKDQKPPVRVPFIQGAMTPSKAASPLLGIFRQAALQRQIESAIPSKGDCDGPFKIPSAWRFSSKDLHRHGEPAVIGFS